MTTYNHSDFTMTDMSPKSDFPILDLTFIRTGSEFGLWTQAFLLIVILELKCYKYLDQAVIFDLVTDKFLDI